MFDLGRWPRILTAARPSRERTKLAGELVSLSSFDWNPALDWVVAIEELRQVVPPEPRNVLVSL